MNLAKYRDLTGLSRDIKGFINLWSDGNRDISLLISTEAQNIKEHITVKSVMLSGQIKDSSEANTARLDAQHGETREHITSESTKIITHFDTDRQADALRKEREEMQTRILSSLWFPEMNARENNIMEASMDTVRWIFGEKDLEWESETESQDSDSQGSDLESRNQVSHSDTGEQKTRSRHLPELNQDSADQKSDTETHNQHPHFSSGKRAESQDGHPIHFRQWLENEGSIFWILGKPGSSKSTVMKYLVQNDQTRRYLYKWRDYVTICRFFFVETCTNPFQRNLRGCLRALLHQAISSQPLILERLLYKRPRLTNKYSEHDWSLEELREVFLEALHADDDSSAFCLFLDGLDEALPDEQASTIELLKILGDLPNVKICVSSRHENIFQQTVRLYAYPFLRTEVSLTLRSKYISSNN